MRDTFYNIPREKVARVAAVYRPDKDGHITLLAQARVPRADDLLSRRRRHERRRPADYFRFAQMLLNGGEYDGQRLLGRMTVNQMFSNQIGTGKTVYVRGDGWGFGLGAGVLTDPAQSAGRALDRHLVVGRRRRHPVLHRPAGGSRRAADGSVQPVCPLRDQAAVLECRLAGDRRQLRPIRSRGSWATRRRADRCARSWSPPSGGPSRAALKQPRERRRSRSILKCAKPSSSPAADAARQVASRVVQHDAAGRSGRARHPPRARAKRPRSIPLRSRK